ncbi:hypothetical protein E3J61_03545 [Candidatus Dependentiae bacterium]|nr:MAG: hypothetical protein E3J61_03545 [Candidatus Dependentiae bacterium]
MGRITRYIFSGFLFVHAFCAADGQRSWFARVRRTAVSLRTRASDWALLKLAREGYKKHDNPQPAPVQSVIKEIDAGQPWVIHGLKNIEAYHIYSSVQKPKACAWYALFNARAIQQLLEQGYTVTESAISAIQPYVEDVLVPGIENREGELLQRLELPALFNGITCEKQERLATYLSLSNYHLIEISRELNIAVLYYSSRQDQELEPFLHQHPGPYRVVVDMEGLLRTIKQKGTSVQHFILGVPTGLRDESYHAVLISIFKRTSDKPLLFYMDSDNLTLDSCGLDYIVPYYVVEFIKELDDAVGKFT